MIDLSFECPEFKKREITKLIKKSIKSGIEECNSKKFYISIFITNNLNMKKLIINIEKK